VNQRCDRLKAALPLKKVSNASREPLWLGLRFTHLALDQFTRGLTGSATSRRHDSSAGSLPVGITDTIGRKEVIVDCNPAAQAGGIKPGMPAATAPGILENLHLEARDPESEQHTLERLAAWCYQYSSQVCIPGTGNEAANAILLEAGASERLFGKARELGHRLERELGHLGYHATAGAAPTPEAAWLAGREGLYIEHHADIRSQAGPLPLACLRLDDRQLLAMDRMGFRQVRDLLKLPRKALTRRFGPGLAGYLDRLLGLQPDPQKLYRPPENFSSRLELPAEINHRQALLFPLRRMMEELCGVLRGGDTAVQSIHIVLGHEDHDDSALDIGLQSPTQDPGRLMRVLQERFERQQLPCAVRDIQVRVPHLLKFQAGQRSLFRNSPGEQEQSIRQLAERLQARLGHGAVGGICGVEDHRPEYSWRKRALDESPACVPLPHRPAWLLPHPQRCDIERYEILAGPERIESGWWDGRDYRRDYFIVRDGSGSTLWAFHEYKPRRGWYLHGIFA
jgi:protein ImuB